MRVTARAGVAYWSDAVNTSGSHATRLPNSAASTNRHCYIYERIRARDMPLVYIRWPARAERQDSFEEARATTIVLRLTRT